MAKDSKSPQHVGVTIRQSVIPRGMSVKDAAKTLGVGRPALSNLLNGKAALSPEMALRLEQAFGANRQELLALQAEYDRAVGKDKSVAARTYVPSFLSIKASQIQDWADSNTEARQLLSVLLRKLVNATGRDLRQVDFPGYDNAERKGWDGVVDAGAATPWIAEGLSGWEFGVSKDPARKAESDYVARLGSVSAADRAQHTFVFVTPRNWPGKTKWAKAKNELGEWKAVRAFDASDLEQWIEESIGAQIWLAERLNIPTAGFKTLEQCWTRWADASEPPLTRDIFAPSLVAHSASFKNWLDEAPTRPFIVAADSRDEALAFMACLVQESAIAPRAQDLTAVFDSAQTLRLLAASSAPFIPIVSTEEGERELAPLYRRLHCIVVRPRNAVDSRPDIALDLLPHDAFEKALAAMGLDREANERLARESGQSPTILRRRLSRIDAIRIPPWAGDTATARTLIPMAFIGAWQAGSNADCEIITALARRSPQEIEESVARLLQFDDCPVWSVGQYRGVASKIDALFAVAKAMTTADIRDFLWLAEYVLSESDPALELPEDKRWAARIYGKVRNHSAVLREGVCETLVILSVHGNNLFRERLGLDVEAMVAELIRRLLTPLTLDKLLSHDRDLPRYAEAAPDEVLALLENDLRQPGPVIYGLMKPAESGIFGNCPRTGLLWALECMAWNPRNLVRVSAILAQLSRIRIEDNWANKPIASLNAIYRAWMPQTAASNEERIKALEVLIRRFPDIAWHVCVDQFDSFSRLGFHSSRPHWRSDASGAGQPVSGKERYDFTRKALDFAIAWVSHDEMTLGDLVQHLDAIPEADQAAVWDRIDTWAEGNADDHARAALRERIRRFAFTRRGRNRGLKQKTRDLAREAYAKLTPRDLVMRHAWLFAKDWVEESADEIQDEDYDFTKRGERIDALRLEAMKEIWEKRGFDGVMALLAGSEAPMAIGRYTANVIPGPKESVDFLQRCVAVGGEVARKLNGCMQGFLIGVSEATREAVFAAIKQEAPVDDLVRLLKCAPFFNHTWRLLDQMDGDIRTRYWREVIPYWNRHTDAELNELIERLLEVGRPHAAFSAVHMDWDRVETSRLKRLLRAVPTTNEEPETVTRLDAYEISEALQSLDGRAGVSVDEMAQLEFMFIGALDHSKHGIPNLERQLAESPSLFVQAVALAFKRRDNGEDPPGWRIEDADRREAAALAAHRLLDQIAHVPGREKDGPIRLEALQQWLTEARQLCAQHGRAQTGDHCIGQWLSREPSEDNGVWPCLPICEAMEAIASEDIASGFRLGVINARGAHWRAEGGSQERELSAKYRNWAQQLAFDFPYVSRVIESIAASYDREAEWHDSEANVRKRVRH